MKRWAPPAVSEAATAPPHERIVGWLSELRRLQGVPLGHLVPDERMLPLESLRFFALDGAWLDALCDGALSLRRADAADAALRSAAIDEARRPAEEKVTGFLLRSVAVWRWPLLRVRACGDGNAPLKRVREERIAPDVLLGLYEGTLREITFSEPAETQHFGFERRGEDQGEELHKELRSVKDEDIGKELGESVVVPTRHDRVIEIDELRKRLVERLGEEDFTPAEFALELVKGVDRVRFRSGPPA